MYCVGLDVGNGFVKCFSSGRSISFPSIFIRNNRSWWDDSHGGNGSKGGGAGGTKNVIGYDAAHVADNPGVRTIRPCISGDILDPQGYKSFVLKALDHVQKGIDISEIHLVAGLPYSSKNLKKKIADYLVRLGAAKCTVLPQAFGTLCEFAGTGSTINIGHGTVELLACKNYKITAGQSIHAGIMNILRGIDESDAGYTRHNFSKKLDSKRLKAGVCDAASYIVNKYQQFMMGIPHEGLVVSGGGIMFPGMREELQSAGLGAFVVPENPAMSNARGLFKYGINMDR